MLHLTNISEFIEWDVRNWSAALDFWQSHTTKNIAACSALELGSRHGGLSLWMALQGARVIASDLDGPTPAAAELHKSRKVSHLITYESIDATSIPYTEKFDIVLFKSMLGAVGTHGGKRSQVQAIEEIHRALAPGGELFFAENLAGSSLHQFCRRQFVEWGAKWRYVSIPEMEEFLKPFSRIQYDVLGFAGAFGRTERQRSILALLDKVFFNYTLPDSYKYIMVGVATK
jgi:SAM-dependent methyltransferase